MLRFALVLVAAIFAAGPATAEPVQLSDVQMDRVAAGQFSVSDFLPLVENTIQGISRNPEERGLRQTTVFIGMGIIADLPILGAIIFYQSGGFGQR